MPYYLIFYDIADPKRLRKIAKIAESIGFRLQKSVFWGQIPEADFIRFKTRLQQILHPEEDALTVVRLCEKCLHRMEHLGLRPGISPQNRTLIF